MTLKSGLCVSIQCNLGTSCAPVPKDQQGEWLVWHNCNP